MSAKPKDTPEKLVMAPTISQGNPISGHGFINVNPPAATPNGPWQGDPTTGLDTDGPQGPGPGPTATPFTDQNS